MTQSELNVLEREVEEARLRVVEDILRLRAPETLDRAKRDLISQAQAKRDEWIGQARGAAVDRAHGIWDDVMARVASNPLAVIAIAAGIGWKLYRHPPIAALLVGGGLFSLMRTDPRQPSPQREFLAKAAETAGSVTEQVQHRLEEATQTVSDIARQASDMASSVKREVEERVAQTTEAARRTFAEAGDTAESIAHRASEAARRTSEAAASAVPKNRDTYLLGLASVAVVTALGVAYQRRANGAHPRQRRRDIAARYRTVEPYRANEDELRSSYYRRENEDPQGSNKRRWQYERT